MFICSVKQGSIPLVQTAQKRHEIDEVRREDPGPVRCDYRGSDIIYHVALKVRETEHELLVGFAGIGRDGYIRA
jgi:hypothetical protein